jgi:hypothetical protein
LHSTFYSFEVKVDLQTHILRQVQMPKPTCDTCGREFSRTAALEKHKLSQKVPCKVPEQLVKKVLEEAGIAAAAAASLALAPAASLALAPIQEFREVSKKFNA